jgi:hypothetical protein
MEIRHGLRCGIFSSLPFFAPLPPRNTFTTVDIHAGWRALSGWALMLIAFRQLFLPFTDLFRPAPDRSGPDPYTEVQAEIAAESKFEAQQPH